MHDFRESLQFSHDASDLPIWEEVYRKAFGQLFQEMVDHRQHGEHQLAGIDRSVILTNSKQLLIDEKVRQKDYGDILLEYVSNDTRNTPGWVCKSLRADYIAYAVLPSGICYLLPVIQLQQAWLVHGEKWRSKYRECRAENVGYCTLSVAVPVEELFPAIGSCLRVNFSVPREDLK